MLKILRLEIVPFIQHQHINRFSPGVLTCIGTLMSGQRRSSGGGLGEFHTTITLLR